MDASCRNRVEMPDTGNIDAQKGSAGDPLRLLIIGAGSRGNAYARAVTESTAARIAGVAEPNRYKREALGKKFIWGSGQPTRENQFESWEDFVRYEKNRQWQYRQDQPVSKGFDGVFICTLDETHMEIITALSSLDLHIMSEKPLATTLNDCLRIYQSLQPDHTGNPTRIFSIGHVLRYSPHNVLLRKLLLEDDVIGNLISIEHTEPVGWWHFAHSYVRGNWRKESKTAPSLLTKSCHDIDFLLWLLCSQPTGPPHLPSLITSVGSLNYFKRSRKPILAGEATNCLSCAVENECIYSAKKIYEEERLKNGIAGWPVNIIDREIEDLLVQEGAAVAIDRLRECLAENYSDKTPAEEIDDRPWFGRCVYESHNDVCDDQIVTMTWEDEPLFTPQERDTIQNPKGRGAKTAIFHMVAFTEKQCERRGRVYGSEGEIEYDGKAITVHNFATKETQTHHPQQLGGKHGGGDKGLVQQFVKAIHAVKSKTSSVEDAQKTHIGCTMEDIIRSHAMVFAAEEARKQKKVIDWKKWWFNNVEEALKGRPVKHTEGSSKVLN